MKKIEKVDWLIEGLRVLAADGFAKITIENLCSILKVTKGSFYHHFGNVDGYIDSLMQYWLEQNTLSFLEEAEKVRGVYQKRRVIYNMAMISSIKEQPIRAWGYSNEAVAAYVRKVDKIRLNYVVKLEEKRGLSKKEARHSAIIQYSVLLGIQQLSANVDEYRKIMSMIVKSNKYKSL
jgi:AcrR family transcriptional regulator